MSGRWTTLGTLGSAQKAVVDPQGIVSTAEVSVQWCAGTGEKWMSAADSLVRQSLVEETPIVSSALRIPSGELVQYSYAVADPKHEYGDVVLRYVNESTIPVSLAVAITKRSPLADSEFVELVRVENTVEVRAGKNVLAVLSKAPSRAKVSTGEVFAEVEFAEANWETMQWRNNETVVVLFPLPHTAALQVVVPLQSAESVSLEQLPPQDRVVAGWVAQTEGAPRVDGLEREFEKPLAAAQRHLLTHAAGELPVTVDGELENVVTTATLAIALDEAGFHSQALRILLNLTDFQSASGAFDVERLDATAAWLVALDRHTQLSAVHVLNDELALRVVNATRWLQRRWRPLLRKSKAFKSGAGPLGMSNEQRVTYDAQWTWRAVNAAIGTLRRSGFTDAANKVESDFAGLESDCLKLGAHLAIPTLSLGEVREMKAEGAPVWTWASEQCGHDPMLTAQFLYSVRRLFVEDAGDVIEILPGIDDEWLGVDLAIHDMPVCGGQLSFAVRWHGLRPALLWEFNGDADVLLRCSSLDEQWSSGERRGDALLAAPVGREFVHVHNDQHDHEHEHEHEHEHDETDSATGASEGESFS